MMDEDEWHDKPEVLAMTYNACMASDIVYYKPSWVHVLQDVFTNQARPGKVYFPGLVDQNNEYHAFDSHHKVFEQRTKTQPAVLLNAGIFNYKRVVVPQKRKQSMCACYKVGKQFKQSKTLLDSQQPASQLLKHIMQKTIWMPSVTTYKQKGTHWAEWMDANLATKCLTVAKLLAMKPGDTCQVVCCNDEFRYTEQAAKQFFADKVNRLRKIAGPTGLEYSTSDSLLGFTGSHKYPNRLDLFKYDPSIQHSLVQSVNDKSCVVWDGRAVKARDLKRLDLLVIACPEGYPVFEASALNDDLVHNNE
jgi:hypothetical protein